MKPSVARKTLIETEKGVVKLKGHRSTLIKMFVLAQPGNVFVDFTITWNKY